VTVPTARRPTATLVRRARPREFGIRVQAGPAVMVNTGLSVGGQAEPPTSAFERLYRSFVAARAGLALALMGTLLFGHAVGFRAPLPALLATGYAALAVTLWVLPRFRKRQPFTSNHLSPRRWVATIGVDLLLFSALALGAKGAAYNFSPLLLMPVLMAALLTSRLSALGVAAAASLGLLGAAFASGVREANLVTELAPAGFVGMGFFATALIAHQAALRLAGEQDAARVSLAIAQRQADINQLVISEMAHGMMAVDQAGVVHVANPAALALVSPDGPPPSLPWPLAQGPATAGLKQMVASAFSQGVTGDAPQALTLEFPSGATRSLTVRCKLVAQNGASPAPAFCVLFLEDARDVQRRVQQEKLAAMGRVSAGIAHEIRNPLSAIGQANALLEETVAPGEQAMLTRMVADNVERLKRIVDDVMEVAPKGPVEEQIIDAAATVHTIVTEWARTNHVAVGPHERLVVALPDAPLPVVFDAEHLRRVLVNLLDNARRYASAAPAAITLSLTVNNDYQARLAVASDGAPIAADVAPYLFEPFFSTRSRGTGLGLYICKELCERYGGAIEHVQLPSGAAHVNQFVIQLRRVSSASPV
jgi:two-component system, NtrC family, sensor histidine kinase PilS